MCGGSCPAECDSVKFELETTTRKVYEDQNILNTIKLDMNRTMEGWNVSSLEEVLRELVAFDINYASLSYTENLEIAKRTLANLIAEVGGIVGNRRNCF